MLYIVLIKLKLTVVGFSLLLISEAFNLDVGMAVPTTKIIRSPRTTDMTIISSIQSLIAYRYMFNDRLLS